ncbi:MAG: PepSY-associated TM helix domain-containing protein [Pseudomonadota bacterium]
MSTSIWPKSSSERVAKSINAHSVVGLALGALLYILAITGTLSVFNRELQRWEQPSAPEMAAISPDAAAAAATAVFSSEPTPTTHLYINFPQPDLPRTVITTDTQAFFANADGTVAGREHFPWTQFLLDLHYYLHLPTILGLTVVGALGAFLLALSISGFMAHPRIFRDAFTFRRGAGRVPLLDLHNRLSVWTAPFHISNALTGAILGLASILAFAVASASFGGDTTAVFSPIFGGEPAPVEGDAPLANIAGPLAYMNDTYPELLTTYFILHDPTTAGQHTTIIAEHGDRLIFGDYYNFDAAGNYEGNIGISDGTLGQQIVGSVYNVHFGNWGGLPVKLAYLVFGLALCTVIASGVRIYFQRQRDRGLAMPRWEAAWEGVVWGTPALLALTLFLAVIGVTEGLGLVAVFWGGLVGIGTTAAIVAAVLPIRRYLKIAVGALLLATLLSHTALHTDAAVSTASMPVSATGVVVAGLLLLGLRRQSRTD